MVIDIKMCRFDNVPWGFRLVGGSDFEVPLTVVKVTEGSIADEAGLRAGDVIVRVNDTDTPSLTHEEVNQIIRHCGNVFFLGVCRENEDTMMDDDKQFPIMGLDNRKTPDSFLGVGSSTCKSPSSRTYSEEREYLPDLGDRPCSVLSENTERKLIEAEIADTFTEETGLPKENNVGLFPKPDVCNASEVFRLLNEEMKEANMEHNNKKDRKWTTFLQKPDRPIPKSKAEIEAEKHAANAYKIKIVKSQPRKPPSFVPAVTEVKIEEKDIPVLEVKPTDAEEVKSTIEEEIKLAMEEEIKLTTEDEIVQTDENIREQEIRNEAPTPTDSEVPSLEDIPEENRQPIVSIVVEDVETETRSTGEIQSRTDSQDTIAERATPIESEEANISNNGESKAAVTVKTDEELALERQLADVQRQLVALSSLPSTIQSTLDAVTKQLAEMLPAFKLQQARRASETEPRPIQLEKTKESNEDSNKLIECESSIQESSSEQKIKENGYESEEKLQNLDEQHFDGECKNEVCETESGANETQDNEKEVKAFTEAIQEQAKQLKPVPVTEEQNIKKQKRHEVIEELEEHLDRKRNPKRSKRAFGPLTPSSERPMVLPGGRRWYRPKDAYNDEFIAETLSSQAELITGHTLGEYHSISVAKQIDNERVNFMKYQKPEKMVDLDSSEVYKFIHDLDGEPIRGIDVRPARVAAAADIYRRAVQF